MEKIIIAINPGAKYLGIAVFCGTELREWRIKSFKGKWSNDKTGKMLKIIADLISQYEPGAIALKKLHPSRSSPGLNEVVKKIRGLSENNGLEVYQYSIKDLEIFFSGKERVRNKRQLCEIIASKYPILYHELQREKSHKNVYYIRMFEAVALGAACSYKLDKN